MRLNRIAPVLVVSTLLCSGAAHAQKPASVGLTMGYPASIGLIWHVTDWFALRPDFSWSRYEATSEAGGSFEAWQLSSGLSLLFTVHEWDALRAYVSPAGGYARQDDVLG
jgi:hypothetical protein